MYTCKNQLAQRRILNAIALVDGRLQMSQDACEILCNRSVGSASVLRSHVAECDVGSESRPDPCTLFLSGETGIICRLQMTLSIREPSVCASLTWLDYCRTSVQMVFRSNHRKILRTARHHFRGRDAIRFFRCRVEIVFITTSRLNKCKTFPEANVLLQILDIGHTTFKRAAVVSSRSLCLPHDSVTVGSTIAHPRRFDLGAVCPDINLVITLEQCWSLVAHLVLLSEKKSTGAELMVGSEKRVSSMRLLSMDV